ncbi:MAG: 4a-hydroxytetrahydrobiopterin dehydratase [Chitinophagales bacterium]
MWREEDNQLKRDFEFANFIDAFAFLSKVAILAEKHNHHPYIFNVYNKVSLGLNTHDAGDIVTQKDRDLAAAIDQL